MAAWWRARGCVPETSKPLSRNGFGVSLMSCLTEDYGLSVYEYCCIDIHPEVLELLSKTPAHPRATSSQWTAFWASSCHRSKACPPKWTGSASGMRSKIGYHFGILLRESHPILFLLEYIWRARGCAPETSKPLSRNGFGLSLMSCLTQDYGLSVYKYCCIDIHPEPIAMFHE